MTELPDHTDYDDDFFDDATEVVSPLSAGSFFADRFRIQGPLGMGGMSAVYAAKDLKENEREVALKVLIKHTADEETRGRFEREYEILKSIEHEGIVKIFAYGHGNAKQKPWLAMEHLVGETLRSRVARENGLSPSQVAPILNATADALAAAHAEGIIHRDLKPDHVFLPAQGPLVKLLDFGLSLVTGSTKKLTATGTVLGTPRYMAPEQIASAHDAGTRADVYALGVIVYEALAGDSPFSASDQGQLLGAIMTGNVQPLLERRPDLDPEIAKVVEQAMHRDVEERIHSPRAFARMFSAASSGRASMDGAPESRISKPTPKPPSWGIVFFMAILCGLGAAALTFWLTR